VQTLHSSTVHVVSQCKAKQCTGVHMELPGGELGKINGRQLF